jgi:hypothetical protein
MPTDNGAASTEVRVGCYAGSRGNEEPRWVEIDGVRCPVREVESRWREPDRDGWRVTLDDGRRLILYYVPNTQLWTVEQI